MSINRLSELGTPRRRGLWPAAVLALSVLAAGLMAACGGGTTQVVSFSPTRVLALGDESSMVVDDGAADGFKYSINDRTATTAGKCLVQPIFVQTLFAHYGFVTAACNPESATPHGFILAKAGARVEDPSTGIVAQVAAISGGLTKSDLFTVMLGTHDVIALFEDVRDGRRTRAEAVAEAQRLGIALASAMNTVLATGARGVVITIPDLGVSPYAVAQTAAVSDAKTLLTALSYQFNAFLRTRIDEQAYDGRNYGLVLADDVSAAMARIPEAYLSSPYVTNVAACTTASALDCTTTTLVTGASVGSHLWATDRLLGPQAHYQIAQQALSRVVNNPF